MTYHLKVKVTKCRANRLVVFNWVIRSNDHVTGRIAYAGRVTRE